MENVLIKGSDLEIDINVRSFWKVNNDEQVSESIKHILKDHYNVFQVNLDLPEKLTGVDDAIKMDNEKDGSISLTLIDAKYKVHEKQEHEEMSNFIEGLVEKLSESLKNEGIIFTLWSCSSVE